MFGNLFFVFELFAFICCVYAYKYLDSNFKIFLPFLAFVVVYEFICMCFMKLLLWHHTNAWSIDLEQVIELVVYGYFLASLDKRKTYQKTVYIATAIGLLISIIDIFFIHGLWAHATIFIVSKNIILATLVCIYFYWLLSKADECPDLLRYPPFLATLGLLLYSLANLFYWGTFDYMLAKNNQELFSITHFAVEISSGFIYSLLGIAFLSFSRTKRMS